MKIKYIGGKSLNYTKLGKIIPNESTEINVVSFFDTANYSEKEIIAILKADKNIEVTEVDSVIEKKIDKESVEKKTEVIADHVKDGIDTFSGKNRGKYK